MDSSYIYIAGRESTGGNAWRIEKRDITDGSLVVGGGGGASSFSWDFDYISPTLIEAATGPTAKNTYNDMNTHTVALDVTDSQGYVCRVIKTVSPRFPLPEFRETAPVTLWFNKAKDFLASIVLD